MDEKVMKINELLMQEEFLTNLIGCVNQMEVQSLFAENGVKISLAEVQELGQMIGSKMDYKGEIKESELEMVSGGVGNSAVSQISTDALANAAGKASIAVSKGITITKVRNCDWIKEFL